MIKRSVILSGLLLALAGTLWAQPNADVYPLNWWAGMKNPELQLMLHGKGIGTASAFSIAYPGVTLKKVNKAESPDYIFLDITVAASAKPGSFNIRFSRKGKAESIPYTLKSRRPGKGTAFAAGVNSADFIYLLMPDRFSNGDPSNDRVPGMRDQSLNRDSIYLRHGGDLQGVINHLNYLQQLGVTTIWMTPVIENDMPNRTEHGYAFTNHYKIEPRIGGGAAYLRLSDELHKRGMKLIQDAVYNHIGSYHFTVLDPPMKDWLHQWPKYTNTTFKDQPLMDPHAAAADKKRMSDGWFTREMPDLNQSNPYVANFLIQHALWCVETFGVDGWRIDTYIYNDLDFMNRCNKALIDEYPKMTMFGETWVHGTANQAFFARNTINTPFKSNLIGVTDFQCNLYGINPALTQPFGWTEGVNKLYQTLANDFLYQDPTRNVIFLDNHDMTRFITQVGDDISKDKMGIAWLLTCRGIPEMYYGTEVLMKGSASPADGWVRLDFPGGWPGDKKNAFTGEGLSEDEKDMQAYTRKLARFRKSSSALQTGRMMQYAPEDGVYVYFRYDGHQSIMCIMNTNDKEMTIDLSRFNERTGGFSKATDIISGSTFPLNQPLAVSGKYLLVAQLNQ